MILAECITLDNCGEDSFHPIVEGVQEGTHRGPRGLVNYRKITVAHHTHALSL
jgi:hypothetical protein